MRTVPSAPDLVVWEPRPCCGVVHFSADAYLDAREETWMPFEAAGAIRYDINRQLVGVVAELLGIVLAIQRSLAGGEERRDEAHHG